MTISRVPIGLAAVLSALPLLATGCSMEDDQPAKAQKPQSSQSTPAKASESTAPAITAAEKTALVAKAEKIVLDDLGDAPLWEGTKAKGYFVSADLVCVDRTYRPGGGLDGKGGNAGSVEVTFPGGRPGEPQDGYCKRRVQKPALPPVDVPADLRGEPGLLTRDNFGADWPLTVDFGVVACADGSVTFRAPDGTKYAVNGTAQAQHRALPKIDAIWADDPDLDGVKINIAPVIDRGRELC